MAISDNGIIGLVGGLGEMFFMERKNFIEGRDHRQQAGTTTSGRAMVRPSRHRQQANVATGNVGDRKDHEQGGKEFLFPNTGHVEDHTSQAGVGTPYLIIVNIILTNKINIW